MKIEDIQYIADLTAKFINLPIRPKAKIHHEVRGYAHINKKHFFIPYSALKRGNHYIIYYIVHEVCHFHNGGTHHGAAFRKIEDKALLYWGLKIEREGVYPKKNGVIKLK